VKWLYTVLSVVTFNEVSHAKVDQADRIVRCHAANCLLQHSLPPSSSLSISLSLLSALFLSRKMHLAAGCLSCNIYYYCGILQMKSSIRRWRRRRRRRYYVYAACAATHNAGRVCCGLEGNVYNGIRLSADKAQPVGMG